MLYDDPSFDSGDRVLTPGGLATIKYKRMAPPDYYKVEVYSVRLDSRADDPNYSGTIYSAEVVTKA